MARYRPRAPIIAVTRNHQTARQAHLYRGIFPVVCKDPVQEAWAEDVDLRVNLAMNVGMWLGARVRAWGGAACTRAPWALWKGAHADVRLQGSWLLTLGMFSLIPPSPSFLSWAEHRKGERTLHCGAEQPNLSPHSSSIGPQAKGSQIIRIVCSLAPYY